LIKAPFLMNVKDKKGISLNHSFEVSDAFFSYDGKYLCTRTYSKLHVWDVDSKIKINEIEIEGGADIRPSIDKHELLIYDRSKGVSVVSLLPRGRVIPLASGPINSWGSTFTKEGQYLVVNEIEGKKRRKLISTTDGKDTLFPGLCEGRRFRIVGAGSHMLAECTNAPPVLWSLTTNTKAWEAESPSRDALEGYEFDKDVTHVAYLERKYLTGDDAWKKHTVLVLVELGSGDKKEISAGDLRINDIKFSPDGKSVVGTYKKQAVIVSIDENKITDQITLPQPVKKSIYLSGEYYVYYTRDKEIIVYNRQNNKVVLKVSSLSSNKNAKVYENNNWLFTHNKEGIASFWDLETGELAKRFDTTGSKDKYKIIEERGLILSADGDGGVWDIESGGQIASFKGYRSVDIALNNSRDEVLLSSTSFGLSSQQTIISLPFYTEGLIDSVLGVLPKNRKCLTNKERVALYMSPLLDKEKSQKGCI